MRKKWFWPVFRILYLVETSLVIGMFSLKWFPPADGNWVRQWVGLNLVNICTLVVGWAFLPWPKDAKTAPKEIPATPAAPPALPFDYKSELETLDGQAGIDAFLNRRWKDRLAGMVRPERKNKFPKVTSELPYKEEWKAFATDGAFCTNSLAYVEIPGTRVTFTLDQPGDVDIHLKACGRTHGTQIGLRVDGVDSEGCRVWTVPGPDDLGELLSPLEMSQKRRFSAGVHSVSAVVRQSLFATITAIVEKSPEIPVRLIVTRS